MAAKQVSPQLIKYLRPRLHFIENYAKGLFDNSTATGSVSFFWRKLMLPLMTGNALEISRLNVTAQIEL